MTVISHLPIQDRYSPALEEGKPAPLPANDTPVADTSEPTQESPQARGDKTLFNLFINTLKNPTSYHELILEDIPATSTFGQLRTQLRSILVSPAMTKWSIEKGVDLSKDVQIFPDKNQLSVQLADGRIQYVDLTDFAGFYLLKAVINALSPSALPFTVFAENKADLHDIAHFHGHALPFIGGYVLPPQMAALSAFADQLLQGAVFEPPREASAFIDPASRLSDLNNRTALSAAIANALPTLRADIINDAKDELRNPHRNNKQVIEQFSRPKVQAFLDTTIEIASNSSYFRSKHLKADVPVTLRQFIGDMGWLLPTSYEELKTFQKALLSPPLVAPAHGNLGGALSWPTQLSNQNQRKLDGVISDVLKKTPDSTLLEHLTRGYQWDPKAFKDDPRRVIDDILKSANAQNLGRAAEREIGELASPDAISDWVLAALYVSLDRPSVFTDPAFSTRTQIAGFDLADIELAGRSASYVRNALANYLIGKKIATPETVDLAMFILLSRKAPALLVRDIPESVTFGSHAWVSFTTAVARIEAQAPGSTSNMTYAEVMMRGDLVPITLADKLVEQQAQSDALKDWGISNGVLVANRQDEYTATQMEGLRTAFSKQISELSAASKVFATPMPDLHERALTVLQRQNPHLSREQLTQKTLDANESGILEFPGPYSILDVFLTPWKDGRRVGKDSYTSRDNKIDLSNVNIDPVSLAYVRESFEADIKEYFNDFEAAAKAQTKYLISKLPLEDRDIIENGKITLAVERSAHRGASGISSSKSSPTLLTVQSEFEGKTHAYEIDLSDNMIRKRSDWTRPISLPTSLAPGITSGVIYEAVRPSGQYRKDLLEATSPHASVGVPKSYFSERSQYIADTLVQDIDIRQFEGELRGQTTLNTEVAFWKKAGNFLLGLIPFYNAINNFAAGNTRDGAIDLAFDALGFILSGVGSAVKGAKAVTAGVAASRGLSQGAKKLARFAIGALNPVDLKGFALAGVQEGLSQAGVFGGGSDMKLPRTAYKYDAVKTFRDVEHATIGKASNMHGGIEDVAATQKNGKWYALDPVSKQPYGLPLEDFVSSS